MCKDKRNSNSKGFKVFSFSKNKNKYEFDVLCIRAAYNMAGRIFDCKRPSKRAIATQKWFAEYLEKIERKNGNEKKIEK